MCYCIIYTRIMKILFFISCGIIVLCILALLYAHYVFTARQWKDTDTAMISIGTLRVRAEIAASALKKSAGLSARISLQKDSGMLFVFSQAYRYPFWMKGMRIPLDIVWIRDATVIFISKDVPAPEKGSFPATVRPPEPVDMVLEIPAGTIEQYNVNIQDAVDIQKIK